VKLTFKCPKHNGYGKELRVVDTTATRNDEAWIEIESCSECLKEARQEGIDSVEEPAHEP